MHLKRKHSEEGSIVFTRLVKKKVRYKKKVMVQKKLRSSTLWCNIKQGLHKLLGVPSPHM